MGCEITKVYSYIGEPRTARCCDCKGYENSQFASVINRYKKECVLTRKFVFAMQSPCERFIIKNSIIIVEDEEGKWLD